MLAEQAYAQCETWTGLPAPKRAILKAAAETLRRGGALGLGASALLRVRQ